MEIIKVRVDDSRSVNNEQTEVNLNPVRPLLTPALKADMQAANRSTSKRSSKLLEISAHEVEC